MKSKLAVAVVVLGTSAAAGAVEPVHSAPEPVAEPPTGGSSVPVPAAAANPEKAADGGAHTFAAPLEFDEAGRRYRVVTLSIAEGRALDVGELGPIRYTVGGLAAIWPGGGLGHLIQGRWRSSGWRFTVGELLGITLATTGLAGALGCGSDAVQAATTADARANAWCSSPVFATAITVGFVGFAGFRVWGVVDAFAGGRAHMDDFESATRKLEAARSRSSTMGLFLTPTFARGASGFAFTLTY